MSLEYLYQGFGQLASMISQDLKSQMLPATKLEDGECLLTVTRSINIGGDPLNVYPFEFTLPSNTLEVVSFSSYTSLLDTLTEGSQGLFGLNVCGNELTGLLIAGKNLYKTKTVSEYSQMTMLNVKPSATKRNMQVSGYYYDTGQAKGARYRLSMNFILKVKR